MTEVDEDLRLAAARRDPHDASSSGGEQDDVIRPDHAGRCGTDLTDGHGLSAIDGYSLDGRIGIEDQGLTVRRKGRSTARIRASYRGHLEIRHGSSKQCAVSRINDARPVGR